MGKFTAQTITAEHDGYHYSAPVAKSARTARSAAQQYCGGLQPPSREVCILVRMVGALNQDEVFLATPAADGEFVVRPAVTPAARAVAASILSLAEDIEGLKREDADSLRRLLESIGIDSTIAKADEEHPASTEFGPVSLAVCDLLDGARLFLHTVHDLPYLDHGDLESGGFSPIDAGKTGGQ